MSRRQGVTQKPYAEVQRLKLDLEAGNRLLMRDPNMVMAVVRKFAPYNLMSLFGIALTGEENGLEDMQIGRKDWAESLLKWRLVDPRRAPIEIYDTNSLPTSIKPGETFTMGISAGYLDANAIVDTENPDYQLIVVSKLSTSGLKVYYKWQLVGGDTSDASFPMSLLQYGRKLSFSGDNAVGEKSAKGQLATIRQNGYEELYNLMQTIRTDYEATGHYLSTKQWTVMFEQFIENGERKEKALGALPFSGDAFSQHLEAISHRLYFGRGNYDVLNRQVVNKSPDGPYSERPTASGLREFCYQSENIYDFNPRQPDKITGLLNHAAMIARDRMRNMPPDTKLDFKLIVRNGGENAVYQAWEDKLIKGNQQVHVSLDSKNTVQVGYGISGFTSLKGDTFRMVNIDYALPRDTVREQATINGYTADKDSWEIMVAPIYRLPNTNGRNNINTVTKKHTLEDGTVINRGLVIGRQVGMTGLTNSTGQDIGAMQEAQIRGAYNDYRVDSMVDKESMGQLSELSMAVYNPDDLILLRPSFPVSVY
jgi:hypothetical protein